MGRDLLIKSYSLKAIDVPESAARQQGEETGPFAGTGSIVPPYDPELLAQLFELSNALRPNIDAYAVNIDGFGQRYEPAIDLDKDNADEKIADAILAERAYQAEIEGQDFNEIDFQALEPSPEEVAERKRSLKLRARIERARLSTFFDFAASGKSFPALRRITRQDLEIQGNAYWEVLRNRQGRIARFVHIPAWTMRLRPLLKEPIAVEERIQISPVKYDSVTVQKRLRTFVQNTDTGEKIFFKEFGDPRIFGRKTGRVYRDLQELQEGNDLPATEIIHFRIHSSFSAYGIPRWIGALLSVLGSRSSEEVNYYYFENKSIPPMAILVSGGRLAKSTKTELVDHIRSQIQGKENFHRILVIEAVSPANKNIDAGPQPQRPVIELRPLTDAQAKDALFQGYDERNIDKTGSAFRIPRLLRGDSRDFNRATADAALTYAENQVFNPERSEFDYFINSQILLELGILFWRFKSNSPVTRDPETMGKIVEAFVKQGILTPEEGRLLAGDIFNTDFATITDLWAKQPIQFTLAGIQTGQMSPQKGDLSVSDLAQGGLLKPAQGAPPNIPSIEADPEQLAQLLLRIRAQIMGAEYGAEIGRLKAERIPDDQTLVVEISPDEMDRFVDRDQ